MLCTCPLSIYSRIMNCVALFCLGDCAAAQRVTVTNRQLSLTWHSLSPSLCVLWICVIASQAQFQCGKCEMFIKSETGIKIHIVTNRQLSLTWHSESLSLCVSSTSPHPFNVTNVKCLSNQRQVLRFTWHSLSPSLCVPWICVIHGHHSQSAISMWPMWKMFVKSEAVIKMSHYNQSKPSSVSSHHL